MGAYTVTVGGQDYDVDAPDERTAWKWANATHLQAIKNDPQQAPQQAVPAGLETVSSQIAPYLPTKNGTDVAGEIAQAPYNLGAKVNDAAATVLPAPFAAGLGAAANAGMEGAGMLAGGVVGMGAGLAAKPVVQDTGRWLMQKALKPSTKDFLLGKGNRAIDTLLEEGVNVSPRGVEKLRKIGEKLNQEAAAEIAASNAIVDKGAVASRLLDTEKRFLAQVDPNADLNAIQSTWTNFLQHPQLAGQASMPVQLAQELKQGTYRQLKDKYGQLGNATEEAQKALALGLKEEIEKGIPTVVPINKRASDIWNALNVTERRAYVGGNNNPVSLPAAFTMVHNPAFGASMIVNTSDKAKSLLARALYTGAGKGAPYFGAGSGALAASLLMDADNK